MPILMAKKLISMSANPPEAMKLLFVMSNRSRNWPTAGNLKTVSNIPSTFRQFFSALLRAFLAWFPKEKKIMK